MQAKIMTPVTSSDNKTSIGGSIGLSLLSTTLFVATIILKQHIGKYTDDLLLIGGTGSYLGALSFSLFSLHDVQKMRNKRRNGERVFAQLQSKMDFLITLSTGAITLLGLLLQTKVLDTKNISKTVIQIALYGGIGTLSARVLAIFFTRKINKEMPQKRKTEDSNHYKVLMVVLIAMLIFGSLGKFTNVIFQKPTEGFKTLSNISFYTSIWGIVASVVGALLCLIYNLGKEYLIPKKLAQKNTEIKEPVLNNNKDKEPVEVGPLFKDPWCNKYYIPQ